MSKMIKIIIILLSLSLILNAKELEKVSVQLQWLDQFQFAGYYMAKEKGFYKDVGLDVEIKKHSVGLKPIDELISKKVTYAIGRSSLLVDKNEGKKIVLISAIFQSSPMVLVAKEDSNITDIKDIMGKTLMATFNDSSVASIEAMLRHHGIRKSDLKTIPYSYSIQELVNGTTDLMTAYITNQVFKLKELGIKYQVFNPKDYGFDVYADILFTSEDEVKNYPKRVVNFREATLKGWRYAFENIDESIELIQKKHNVQNKSVEALRYEAQELKKLAYFKTSILGKIEPSKIQRIYDMYNIMGLVDKQINIDKFIFKSKEDTDLVFSEDEQAYLKDKQELNVCIDPNWMPFESFKGKEHIGLSAEYFKIFEKELNLHLLIIHTDSWSQTLEFAKQRKCDVVSLIAKTKKREEYLNFTTPLITTPIVLATKLDTSFIVDFKSIVNKKIGIPKNYSIVKIIKKKYPNLRIVEVENIEVGLTKVRNGELYGFIGSLATIGHMLQEEFLGELKISGKFDEKLALPIGIRDDEKILLDIFQKLINNIDNEQHQNIFNKWVSLNIEKRVDYTLVWQLFIGFIFILFIGSVFYIRQMKKVIRQEREIKRSTKMFEIIFNTVKDGIAILDLESNFLLVNNAYENITGFSKEELYKTSCIAMTSPDMVESSKKVLATMLEKGFYGGYYKQCIVKDGRVIDVVLDMILMEDKKSILMVTKDITFRKKYERERKMQEKQMFHQSKLAQMGEMISMIAHQWRQPLGAISTSAIDIKIKMELELYDLEEIEGREEFLKYLKNSLDNIEYFTQNLTSTIDDFRDFYKKNKVPKSLVIEDPIKKALKIIRDSLKANNITLLEEYNSKKEIDLFDGEIMQVILNILKNAQDNFSNKEIKSPIIKIVTNDTDKGVSFNICDNGGGIQHAIIEKIFEPYFSTKHEKNGTGLGLYMSKMIVEEHHKGSLSVENVDNGTCFKIEINNNWDMS